MVIDARRNYISQLEAAIKDCGATVSLRPFLCIMQFYLSVVGGLATGRHSKTSQKLTQLEREAYSVSKAQQKPLFEKIKAYKKDFEDRKREYVRDACKF